MFRHLGTRLGLALLVAGAALASLQPAAVAQPCGGSGPAATLCVLNAERAAEGLRPLELDARLMRAARANARAIAEPPASAGPGVGLGDAAMIRAGSPPREVSLAARRRSDAECADRGLEPSAETLSAIAETTLCLLNGERADHGLAALTTNGQLAAAATDHARDLVAGSYFSHTGRDGSDVFDRVQRSGYLPPDAGWTLGENLAWGTGSLAMPGAIMQAWMNSPGHRENILNPDFRDVGIGVVPGNPAQRDGLGATYVTEFGAIEGVSRPAQDLKRRVARTGWLRRRARWLLGETVAWGRGQFVEPTAVVAAWMLSAPHRRVALRPRFRRVGIAIGRTASGAATFVADFGAGRRSLRRPGVGAVRRRARRWAPQAAGVRAAAAARAPRTTRTSSSAAE